MNAVRARYGAILVAALLGLGLARAALAAASCTTYDAQSLPTSTFRGGEKIIVKGTGFGPNARVLVSLQQGTRTIELTGADANDLGAFTVTDAAIPRTVADGEAAIRAIDARGSATCPITLEAAAEEETGLSGVFWIWGGLLAVFAIVLGALTYRRWKTERLKEAVDSLAWREQFDARNDERTVATRTPERTSMVAAGRPERSAIAELEPPHRPQRREAASPAAFDPVLPPPRPRFDESMRRTAPFPPPAHQDDEESPIGAPRPFDARFSVESMSPPGAPWSIASASEDHDAWQAPDTAPERRPLGSVNEDPAPIAVREDRVLDASPDRPPLPVVSRPTAQRPAGEPSRTEASLTEPSVVEPRRSVSSQAPHARSAVESFATATPVEKSFAQALREFLDATEARTHSPDAEFRRPERTPASGRAAIEPPLLDRPFIPSRPMRRSEAPRRPAEDRGAPLGGATHPVEPHVEPSHTVAADPSAAFRPREPTMRAEMQPEGAVPVAPEPQPLVPEIEPSASQDPPAEPATAESEPALPELEPERDHVAPEPVVRASDLRLEPEAEPPAASVDTSDAEADAPPAPAPAPTPPVRPARRPVAPEPEPHEWDQPPARDRARPPPPAVPRPAAARPRPRRPAADTAIEEPPVLPVGWDEGRLRPAGKRSSDAIERLRREVRDWRR